jgi:hypothetical protein
MTEFERKATALTSVLIFALAFGLVESVRNEAEFGHQQGCLSLPAFGNHFHHRVQDVYPFQRLAIILTIESTMFIPSSVWQSFSPSSPDQMYCS